jgi:hypothetical protein
MPRNRKGGFRDMYILMGGFPLGMDGLVQVVQHRERDLIWRRLGNHPAVPLLAPAWLMRLDGLSFTRTTRYNVHTALW